MLRAIRPPLFLLLCTPLIAAWSGGGSGTGSWDRGGGASRMVALSGVARFDDTLRAVVNGTVEGGAEALVFVTVPRHLDGQALPAGDARVEVAYEEYGPDGALRFAADRAEQGTVTLSSGARRATLRLSAVWYDAGAEDPHRRIEDATLVLEPTDGTGDDVDDGYHGGGSVHAGGGCDTTVDPEPEPYYADDSTGCEGDDLDGGDDDWGGDSGGGCEGDDLSSGGDSGGGCEGDDLGGGSSGADSASCEGDAIASAGPARRSPTVVRLINQLPWLMVFVGLRLMRRRRGPRRRR